MMKRYLALFLCFSFLLANPVEAAVVSNQDAMTQPESYLTLAAKKKARINVKSDQEKINSKKGNGTEKNRAMVKNASRYSPEDLELLARLVHAEAQGEPYQGKVAVAATVLNRVKDPDYPATIAAVIYEYNQGYQYCPVRNGAINCTADDQAWRAVGEALTGKDPTGGAVSFFNPAQSSNTWIRQQSYAATIGNHIFVK